MELPTRKQEAWRWADLSHAAANAEHPAPANDTANDAAPDVAHLWLDLPGARHLFIGGHAAGGTDVAVAADTSFPAHPLADRAAHAASTGTLLEVAAGEDAGIVQIAHVGTSGAAHGVTRVRLAAGARLTVIETLADSGADHWLNQRFDADVGTGAQLTRIVRILNAHGLASERAAIRLGEQARFTQVAIVLGEGDARSDALVWHDGAGAHADVNGVLLGDGKATLDAMTTLEHRVPGTTSEQVWRLVATGSAQVSVAGGVKVARAAQKTDANQSLKALVLKRTAAANLKPELEIFADDVQCAHGCTVGELDKMSLFYLESRGVPRPEAEALLTHAFVADALAILSDERLTAALDGETHNWLEMRA